jgi:hypothetical protein
VTSYTKMHLVFGLTLALGYHRTELGSIYTPESFKVDDYERSPNGLASCTGSGRKTLSSQLWDKLIRLYRRIYCIVILTHSELTRKVCQCLSGVQTSYSLLRFIPPKNSMFSGRPFCPIHVVHYRVEEINRTNFIGLDLG